MKINKQALMRIIKEERQSVIDDLLLQEREAQGIGVGLDVPDEEMLSRARIGHVAASEPSLGGDIPLGASGVPVSVVVEPGADYPFGPSLEDELRLQAQGENFLKQQLRQMIAEELKSLEEAHYRRDEDYDPREEEYAADPGPAGMIPDPGTVKSHVLWQDLNLLLMQWEDRNHPYYHDLRNMMEMHAAQGEEEPEQKFA